MHFVSAQGQGFQMMAVQMPLVAPVLPKTQMAEMQRQKTHHRLQCQCWCSQMVPQMRLWKVLKNQMHLTQV